jgi:hypothetical protein
MMMRFGIFAFSFLMAGLMSWNSNAQSRSTRPKTDNTDRSVQVIHKKEEPPRIHYRYLYKKSTQGLLLGNKCMEDKYDEMQLKYIAAPKSAGVYTSEADRLWSNFQTKIALFFTEGPFWKFKIKKARKKCRQLTGDFTG